MHGHVKTSKKKKNVKWENVNMSYMTRSFIFILMEWVTAGGL